MDLRKRGNISSYRKSNTISRPPYSFDLKETYPFIATIKRKLHNSPILSKIYLAISAIILIPIRLPILIFCWVSICILCNAAHPIKEHTWRSKVRHFCLQVLYRGILWCHGIWYIREINPELRAKDLDAITKENGGSGNPDDKAKIVVVAPHSTIIDGLHWILCCTSAVIKSDFGKVPVISGVIASINPIYVDREIQASRQLTAKAIMDHVKKPDSLPLCFFPEGTTTNGKSLVHFKPGAFIAGLPVTPALIKFPKPWGFGGANLTQWGLVGGPDAVHCVTLLQLCVPYQPCYIKWLPEYIPSLEEKQSPELFAHNVQKLMAKEFDDCESTDYLLQDGLLLRYFRDKKLSFEIAYSLHIVELFDVLQEQISTKSLMKMVDEYRIKYNKSCNLISFQNCKHISPHSAEELKTIFNNFIRCRVEDNDRCLEIRKLVSEQNDDMTLKKYIFAKCLAAQKIGVKVDEIQQDFEAKILGF